MAPRLREAGEQFRNIYLTPDLTRAEQEHFRELRSELKTKRDAGEDVVIYRGRIIPRQEKSDKDGKGFEQKQVKRTTTRDTCISRDSSNWLPGLSACDGQVQPKRKGLNIYYSNADQLLNKIEELKMHITNRQPDVIIICEVIPKAQLLPVARVCLAIDGYTEYINFDAEAEGLGRSGQRGIIIYVCNGHHVQEPPPFGIFSEQLWLKIETMPQ